jgi:hypothetical protein
VEHCCLQVSGHSQAHVVTHLSNDDAAVVDAAAAALEMEKRLRRLRLAAIRRPLHVALNLNMLWFRLRRCLVLPLAYEDSLIWALALDRWISPLFSVYDGHGNNVDRRLKIWILDAMVW